MRLDPLQTTIQTKAVFWLFWSYIRKYPFLLLLHIGGVLLIQIATLASPWYLRQLFNILAASAPSPEVLTQLTGIVGIIAFTWFIGWSGSRFDYLSNMYLQVRIMADLMGDTYRYIAHHSYNFFISNFAGSLVHKINRTPRAFQILMDTITLQLFPTLFFIVGAVVILAFQNFLLGLVLGVWCVVFAAFQTYVSIIRQPSRIARAKIESEIVATLADSISNHTTTILFSGISHEHMLVRKVTDAWYTSAVRTWLIDHHIWAGIGFFMIAVQTGLLYVAVRLWSEGLLTIGDFVLIQSYLLIIFERLVSINRELRRFYDALADASDTVEILNMPHEITDTPDAKLLSISKAEIAFKKVSFYFNKTHEVLTNLDLKIRTGERVGLVGPSGAGKSTITKLLLRLYDVEKGSIEIDGQNIAEVTQESLRNAIAFVPQEPVLFHRTLMENIRYGKMDATEGEIIEAAKKAHCHEFISRLPQGYDTFVGERGIKLSGGERQRVAIARAILKDAPILILDEATSSLDSESEALIQDALETLMKDKTVIVIAHRLSTIMKMDRIVVLEGGKIAAEGSHTELLAQDGLYQKLWSIQAGGFLKDEEPEETPEIRES